MRTFAVILCSGGLDSSVLSYFISKRKYSDFYMLFFDYGQQSLIEEERSARYIASCLGFKFNKIKIPNLRNRGSKFTKGGSLSNTKKESDSWYFPFRNSIFISHAVAVAEGIMKKGDSADIFLGFKSEGKESYPDTTERYVKEINRLVSIATEKRIKIKAPFIKMDKEDIISLGERLGVPFKESISCYKPNKIHCGTCLACRLRKAGFYWANVSDPTLYKK